VGGRKAAPSVSQLLRFVGHRPQANGIAQTPG